MEQQVSFQLWGELKRYAWDYAMSDRPLPTDEECAAWLQERLDHDSARLPPQAFDFYTSELCAMIDDYRSGRMR